MIDKMIMIESISKENMTDVLKFPIQIESQKVKHHGDALGEVYAHSKWTECCYLRHSS